MKFIPKICGKNFLHITSFCDDMDRFIGAEDITIIQGTDFDPTSGVTAVDSEGNILPFTVTPSELQSLCTLGTTTFTYQTETFLKQREVTVVQAPLPTITLPTASVTCDSEVCDAQTDPNTIGIGETLNTMTGVSATDAHGNTLAVTCLEGSSVVYTTGGLKLLHYTATDECGNVGTATRAITVLAGNWSGIGNVTINQGTSFDPTDGVHAYDYQGNEVQFTVTPNSIDTCDVGTTTLTYSASGLADATRTVTVNAISNPAIFGVPSTTLEVEVGDTFDPLDGVTAYDGNGNAVVVSVELISYRTVIYADGTLIINEPSSDIASNVTAHGTASHVYDAMKPDGSNYVWTTTPETLWHESYEVKSSIKAVEIGSPIKPISTAYWFISLPYCTDIDLTNLDSSRVTSMAHMFHNALRLESVNLDVLDTSNVTNFEAFLYETDALINADLSNFNTSSATNMRQMFYRMQNVETIDVSSFDTQNVTDMGDMFTSCYKLETIYASSRFVTTNETVSSSVFYGDTYLVGGAGTAYDASHVDKTYARIDNPPTAPGYFTAKA